jgi:hypothetical protein
VQNIAVSFEAASLLLPLIQPKSFVAASTHAQSEETLPESMLNSKDFWRNLFAALTENSMFNFKINSDAAQGSSLATMCGFT